MSIKPEGSAAVPIDKKKVAVFGSGGSIMSEGDLKQRTIYLACDGFGQDLLNEIKTYLETNHHKGTEVIDLGCDTYYDSAAKVAKVIANSNANDDKNSTSSSNNESENLGILFCGTGMGVGIIANKFSGIRAATCENATAARCARAINNSNVLCLGQLVTKPDTAKLITSEFLNQGFISQPKGEDGEPVSWWNGDVETFLASSMEGISRVEKEAIS